MDLTCFVGLTYVGSTSTINMPHVIVKNDYYMTSNTQEVVNVYKSVIAMWHILIRPCSTIIFIHMATLYMLYYIKEEELKHLLMIFQLFTNNRMSTICT
jgi:hypothetical protein